MTVVAGTEAAPDMGVVLGQNLFRQALGTGDLSPFAAAAEYMQAAPDAQRQADTWKGIRFGLAGLAIHGWAESITEPLPEPIPFGSGTIGYRFTDRSGIDTSPAETMRTDDFSRQWVTKGHRAMGNLAYGLRYSFRAYLDTDHTIGSIPVSDIIDALAGYVKIGADMGLGGMPDLYVNGDPRYHLYASDTQTRNGVIGSLASTGGNTMRFSTPATSMAMHYGVTGREIIDPHDPPLRQNGAELPAQAMVEDLMMDAAKFALHASQRRDGTRVALPAEAPVLPIFQIRTSLRGKPEVGWQYKNKPAIAQLKPGTTPPRDKTVGVTARQKCPVGYSADAFSDDAGQRLVEATMYNFRQRGLTDPKVFLERQYDYIPTWRQNLGDAVNHRLDMIQLYMEPRLPRFLRRMLGIRY